MIERSEYLKKLISFKDKNLIKVISGIRRCGKSTLLELFKDCLLKNGVKKSQIISLNFEDPDNEELTDYKKLYEYCRVQKGTFAPNNEKDCHVEIKFTSLAINGVTVLLFASPSASARSFRNDDKTKDTIFAKNNPFYTSFSLSGISDKSTLPSASYNSGIKPKILAYEY
ncbi:MAG: AAA family ATPase [Candidatus Gastranaerophilales bacterium]|nr:AAA family ATPase [Candidatus Gastranaerophilales bacterium]